MVEAEWRIVIRGWNKEEYVLVILFMCGFVK